MHHTQRHWLQADAPTAALARKLLELLLSEGLPHAQALQALLLVYVSAASTHECCRETSARQLLQAGGLLLADPLGAANPSRVTH